MLIRLLTPLLFLVLSFSSTQLLGKGDKVDTEAKIRAVYLYNFTKYIEWPNVNTSKKGIFKIGVYGENSAIITVLENMSKVKKVQGNSFEIETINNISEIDASFHMIYFRNLNGTSLKDIYLEIGKKPILIVTDGTHQDESMIDFTEIGNRLRFTLNNREVEKQGLKVANTLENIAVLVTSTKSHPRRSITNKTESKADIQAEEIPVIPEVKRKRELTVEEFDALFIKMQNDLVEEKSKSESKDKEIRSLRNSVIELESFILLKESELEIVQKRILKQSSELEKISSSVGLKEQEYLENIQLAKESKVELEKAKKILDKTKKELSQTSSLLDSQRLISYLAFFILIIIAVLGGLTYKNYKKQKNQALIISNQKDEVEEKNREITDSIQYAKRIQEAILPPLKLVESHLKDSFIFYAPKDIVAGDFYWMETKGDWVLFAAADCTGHGVPGALVSVVCSNALNRAVREFELTEPAKILDKTLEIVIERFDKSEEVVKDGMDIALCAYNPKTLELQYAGAHNPLWIIRKNAAELEEIKGNKQPIGRYAEHTKFSNHTIQLQNQDSFYIASDGYVDQFGGEKGKKFKSINFKKLLLSISENTIEEQKNKIINVFNDWKGDLEQLDDVCVIGVRV